MDSYLHFDGTQSYIEAADSADFSVATTGGFTAAAWIRPEVLTFRKSENGYVHWMGKGETGRHEWTFRMYGADNTVGRANRISFYLFNPDGGEGIGSHFQDPSNPVEKGVWLHVAGSADAKRTYLYINGVKVDSDVYRPAIRPKRGSAPLRIGTRDFKSYFQGEIREVRIWNRKLGDEEVAATYASGVAAQSGLVAEYSLSSDLVPDTAGHHIGIINNASWLPQDNS